MKFHRTFWFPSGLAFVLLAGSLAHAGQNPNGDAVHASINPLRALDKASFKSFVERPLFDPARRLPPPFAAMVSQPAAAPPEPPPNVHLLGVIQGKIDLAIVGQDGNTKTQMLSSGDHIGDWQVTVLPSVGLRLRNAERVVDYGLFDKGNAMSQPIASGIEAISPPPPPTMAARNARLQRRTY